MSTRYYSTERPVDIGTYPKPAGNRVLDIQNFYKKTFCSEIDRMAYGFIEYEKELEKKDARAYELLKAWS